eukprot:998536-Alexandrium_andersonii.AAC.1
MSASLVGSEMCIRDSMSPATAHPPTYPNPHPDANIPVRSNADTHSALPVSYTHLTLPTICSV